MKNTSIYISLMLAFLFISCSKNEVEEIDQGVKGFVIELKDSGTNTQTRANSVSLSEVIQSINLFFDPIDTNISPFTIGGDDIRIQDSNGKYIAYFSINNTALLDKDYKIYMVANRDIPEGVDSFTELQSAIITEDLNNIDTKYLLMSGQVKRGAGEVIHLSTTDTKLGNVTLVRVPSKISLKVTFTDKFNIGNCVANKYNIVGQKLDFNDYNTQGYYYNPAGIAGGVEALNTTNKDLEFELPDKVLNSTLYSYPNQWKDDATRETYLMLMIKVKTDCAGPVKSLYYKIPIDGKNSSSVTQNNKELKANHNYILKVNIDQEGSTDPENPFELEGSYEIKEWELGDINTSIDEFHYLFVTPEYVELYDVNSHSFIAETSREGVVAKDISVTASYHTLTSEGQKVTSKYGDSSSLYDEFKNLAQFLQITGLPSDLKKINFKGSLEPSKNNLIKDISFIVHQTKDTQEVLDRKVVMKQYPDIAINTYYGLSSGFLPEGTGLTGAILEIFKKILWGITPRVHHFEVMVPKDMLVTYPPTRRIYVFGYFQATDPSPEYAEYVAPSFIFASKKYQTALSSAFNWNLLACRWYTETLQGPGGKKIVLEDFRLPTRAELQLLVDREHHNSILFNKGDIFGDKVPFGDRTYWAADGLYDVDDNGKIKKSNGTLGYMPCVQSITTELK